MVEIKEQLSNINYTHMDNKENKYIVIHYVGAVSTAKNNADYFQNVDRQASANYFVDDNEIYRVVKDTDRAWHCGTNGTYYSECRNNNSIGIEMCCYMNNGVLDISDKVIENTIELTKLLMEKYNISVDKVIRHYDVTHKNCPAPFVNDVNRWNDFKSRLNTTTIFQTAMSIIDLANAVIRGEYGVGEERKQKLGSLYTEVQAKVNEILRANKAPARKSNEDIAREVINGNWGNGATRKQKLEAAGYNYNDIQRVVNQMLR